MNYNQKTDSCAVNRCQQMLDLREVVLFFNLIMSFFLLEKRGSGSRSRISLLYQSDEVVYIMTYTKKNTGPPSVSPSADQMWTANRLKKCLQQDRKP